MEKVLLLRSYLVGHALSIADIAIYAALRGECVLCDTIIGMVTTGNQNWSTTYPKLTRWFSLVGSDSCVKAAEKQWPRKTLVCVSNNFMHLMLRW